MKKALITWGGWDGHEPDKTAKIFEDILKKENYDVTVVTDYKWLDDKEYIQTLDLVVPVHTGSGPVDKANDFSALIKSGTGLGGWHGGMCDSSTHPEYMFMTGGKFVCHPGGIVEYEVNITKKDDLIVKGLNDFKMNSEQYYMLVDPHIEVIAETTFRDRPDWWGYEFVKGVTMPVVWKRMWGKGKVFYCALGHVAKDFDVPEAKEIVRRGLLWATR